MKGTLLACAASALLGSVAGHGERRHGHEEFHRMKRQAYASLVPANDTCTTIINTYYGEPTLIYEAPPPPPITTTAACTTSTSTSVYVAPPTTTPAAAAAPPATPGPGSAPSGGSWSLSYTPYTTSGCKSAGEVDGDIGKIASMGFAAVRIYNSDCSQLTYVGDACKKYGLRLSVGLWITSPDEDAVQSQIQAITSYFQGDYGIVAHVVVGNEVLANTGYGVTASCLAGFINTVRAALRSAGYAGSVSTSEVPGPLFAAAGTLCPAIDDVLANVHPFFDPNTSAGQAGTYVAGILGRMEAMCGGSRRAWNMETGWPTAGQADGQAVPGFAEQQTAVLAIKAAAGDRSSFFSFEDDLWKGKGLFQVEQSWGLASLYDLL